MQNVKYVEILKVSRLCMEAMLCGCAEMRIWPGTMTKSKGCPALKSLIDTNTVNIQAAEWVERDSPHQNSPVAPAFTDWKLERMDGAKPN
jgi:hypothetical protein